MSFAGWIGYVWLNGRLIGRIAGGQVDAIHDDCLAPLAFLVSLFLCMQSFVYTVLQVSHEFLATKRPSLMCHRGSRRDHLLSMPVHR